jgi:F-type H+-transporting ATPase subunit epsilon
MASTVHCSIVSAEQEIFSGMVEMVVASGTIGELGIFPGHTPLLSGVKPGPVRLRLEGGE